MMVAILICGESNYWQGYAHYQMGQREQAKSFLARGYQSHGKLY